MVDRASSGESCNLAYLLAQVVTDCVWCGALQWMLYKVTKLQLMSRIKFKEHDEQFQVTVIYKLVISRKFCIKYTLTTAFQMHILVGTPRKTQKTLPEKTAFFAVDNREPYTSLGSHSSRQDRDNKNKQMQQELHFVTPRHPITQPNTVT